MCARSAGAVPQPHKARFGSGVKLSLLCEQSLNHLLRAQQHEAGSDTVDVCLGVVYSCNTLRTLEHFTARPSDTGAQRIAVAHRAARCHDRVVFTPNTTSAAALEGPQLVTWEAGAAVPLALVRITHSVKCIVCLNQHLLAEGYACPCSSMHFTCWDCLLQRYSAALKADSVQGTLNAQGDLLCCEFHCRHPITVSVLAAEHATEAVLCA